MTETGSLSDDPGTCSPSSSSGGSSQSSGKLIYLFFINFYNFCGGSCSVVHTILNDHLSYIFFPMLGGGSPFKIMASIFCLIIREQEAGCSGVITKKGVRKSKVYI